MLSDQMCALTLASAALVGVLLATPAANVALAAQAASPLKYTVTITPQFRRGRQWTGLLTIAADAHGAVTGTYKSTTIAPDPFYSQHVTVTGQESGKQITLVFRMLPPATFKVQGQFHGDNFSGTAHDQQNNAFEFLAQRLHT